MTRQGFQKGYTPWNKGKKGIYKHSKEIREKIRLSKLGNKNPMFGKKSWSYGLKIKEIYPHLGFQKGHRTNVGRHFSEETKRKMSRITLERKERLGYINSPETRKRMSLAQKNSEECKKNIKKLKEIRKATIFPLKDSSIEIKIQNFLKQLRIEFFTHQYMHIEYGYQCDILIPSIKTIIECDGDYWHGNSQKFNYTKLSNRIRNQRVLDFERTNQLERKGFRVIRLWGSQIKKMQLNDLKEKLNAINNF